MQGLEDIVSRINQLEAWSTNGATLQQCMTVSVELEELREARKLMEHTARIKAKIESGNAIDKSIIDREAIKGLNYKEAHEKAKVVKKIEHRLYRTVTDILVNPYCLLFNTVIVDLISDISQITELHKLLDTRSHCYIICKYEHIRIVENLGKLINIDFMSVLIHTFKYSSKNKNPSIGYKEHYECIVYVNIGNKPVNHLLPNVIESTYAKGSRNLGFYTNLLLRSANAGDTILGINITNGNLIKAAQAMLCSTVIIPADNTAKLECEKTIKELQFK